MDWEECLKTVYGELEVVNSSVSVCGFRLPMDVRKCRNVSVADRAAAYQVILEHNMDGIGFDCPLCHYVSLSHFAMAVRASAFFLARPYTWSKADDPAFNTAIRTGKLCGVTLDAEQIMFLNTYVRNTFGICWSRTSDNENLIAKKIKDCGGAPVIEIKTTASKLLAAYLSDRDPFAPAKYFLVDMQYVTWKDLNAVSFSTKDLYDVNYAFLRHKEMLSIMAKTYKVQDEVRLIVERLDNGDEKLVENKFFPKQIDLSEVITGIKLHGWNRTVNEKAFVESYAKLLNTQVEVVS